MDIKLFPEIGGEDGIWIEYQESAPVPVYIPGWAEIWILVKQRLWADWKFLRAKVKKWLHI